MKVEIEVNAEEYGFVGKENLRKAWEHLGAAYGKLWTEACYDATTEECKQLARKVLDHLSEANKLLKFKP